MDKQEAFLAEHICCPCHLATQEKVAGVLCIAGIVSAGSWDQQGGCSSQGGGGILSQERCLVTPIMEARKEADIKDTAALTTGSPRLADSNCPSPGTEPKYEEHFSRPELE